MGDELRREEPPYTIENVLREILACAEQAGVPQIALLASGGLLLVASDQRVDSERKVSTEGGVRTSETQADPAIAAWAAGETREIVVQLAKDIITAVESHDTHRMQHIEQYARRIKRIAGGAR